MTFVNIIHITSITFLIVNSSVTYADDTIDISVAERYQPYINDLIDAFLKKLNPKVSFNVCKSGYLYSPNMENYGKRKFDIMLFHDNITDYESVYIEWKLCPVKKIWSKYRYFLGQKRMIVIASHDMKDVKSLHINELRHFLTTDSKVEGSRYTLDTKTVVFGPEKYAPEMKNKIHTVKYINTYPLSINFTLSANILLDDTKCSKYQFTSFADHDGWTVPEDDKYIPCKSTSEILDNVNKRKKTIGIIPYMFRPIKNAHRVSVISLQKNDDSPPVCPPLKPIVKHDYPFSLLISLFVQPESPDVAHEFCRFCISEFGARISEKYGIVTKWHERNYYADRRVKAMKAGKGERIRMVGDALFAEAAQGLAVAYVRAKKPIQFRYVPRDPGIDADYVRRFVTAGKRKQDYRMPLFLCRGPLAPGGEHDLPGLKQYRLAADAPVVVVNAANDIPSLTPDAVAKIFTGRVTQWGAVSASTGRIAACALKTDPAVGRYVRRRSGGRMPPAIHRCGDRRALCGRIAADVQAIGLLGAAHLAGGRDRLPGGVRVVSIAGRAGPVMPGGKTILSGAYPLSAGMYVCVAGDVGEAAADLVAFLRSEDAQAAFAECGMITVASRLSLPGDGDAATPGIPAADDADQGQSDAEQDRKREEQAIPESTEGDGVGGLPFD